MRENWDEFKELDLERIKKNGIIPWHTLKFDYDIG